MAISHRATGTAVFSANDFAAGIPAATQAGDLMLFLFGGKPWNSSPGVIGVGWTDLGSTFQDGTTAVSGADTGSMNVGGFWKEHDGSEVDPQLDEGPNAFDVYGGLVMSFSKGAGETWNTPTINGGGDATAGTGFSVITGSINLQAGDHVVSWAAFRSDAATPCSSHLVQTHSGSTFTNTHDPATDPETTTGFDMGMCFNRATVNTGGGIQVATLAATLAAAHTGAAAIVRIHVTAAPAGGDDLSPAGQMGYYGL